MGLGDTWALMAVQDVRLGTQTECQLAQRQEDGTVAIHRQIQFGYQ